MELDEGDYDLALEVYFCAFLGRATQEDLDFAFRWTQYHDYRDAEVARRARLEAET